MSGASISSVRHDGAASEATVAFEQVTPAIGAHIRNVDLGTVLADDTIEQLRAGLHHYGVLFFHDQSLRSDEAQVELGSRFGPIYQHAFFPQSHDHSIDHLVTVIDSGDSAAYDRRPSKAGKTENNTGWHSDATFEENPPYVAILRPLQLPSLGGDTLWASMYAAYEGLSSKMQHLIDGLEAVHDPRVVASWSSGADASQARSCTHPLVGTDPIANRKFIYVNSNYVTHILGMSRQESDSILRLLYDQANDPSYQVRHSWTAGDVTMWHERVTQHFGVGDYAERRIMHRVIAAGGPVS